MTDLPGPGGLQSGPSRLPFVVVVFSGEPIAKGRARSRVVHTKSGSQFASHFTPTKTRKYEAKLADLAKLAMDGRPPLEGPIEVSIEARFSVPKSWSNKKRERALSGDLKHVTRPDADNCGKACLDALNKIAWRDDSQIANISIRKSYSLSPILIIQVWTLT